MSRRLLAVVAVLIATVTSALAIGRLIVPELWLPRTLVCLAVVTLVLALARWRTSSPTLPSFAALAGGVLSIQAVYFPEQTVLRVLPTRATIDAVVVAVPTAIADIRQAAPPITTSDSVALFATVGIVLVMLLAEMLAVGAYAPVWAGVPLAGLWAVPITMGAAVDPGIFLIAAAAFVVVVAVQAREHPPRRRSARAAIITAAVTAMALLATLVAAPAVLQIPAPARLHTVYDLVDSGSTRLDLGLDLREDLVRGDDDVALLRYTGAPPEQVGPLHAYTMTDFDGSSWERGPEGDSVPADEGGLWPQSLDGVDLADERVIEVLVEELRQDRLLLPGEPRSVDAPDDARYLPEVDEIATDVSGSVPYQVRFSPRVLDAEQLTTLDVTALAGQVPPEVLEVPDTGYQGEIAGLARSVVADAGAESAHEQAVAIQNWLRDPARFVYTTTISPPQTTDAVWDFLNDREGYCVQFATSMVVMARSLGIPARIAVGFLPGERDGSSAAVTAADAHAWPQLLFPGVGWVRFEPTPAVQTGSAPGYAPAPQTDDDPTTGATEPATAPSSAQAPTAEEQTSATAGTGDTGGARGPTSPALPVLALVMLVAVAVAAAALARRRAAARTPEVRTLWRQAMLDLHRGGVDVCEAMTPRAVQRAAAEHLDDDGRDALSDLASAVEEISYARAAASRLTSAELSAAAQTVRTSAREIGGAPIKQPVDG